MTQPGIDPERININNLVSCAQWTKKLNLSDEQLREAVQTVGDKTTDVEMHFKSALSTTKADRVRNLRDA